MIIDKQRKIILFVLLMGVFCGPVQSQTAALALKIDSLQDILHQTDGAQQSAIQLELAKTFAAFDPPKAEMQLRQLLSDSMHNELKKAHQSEALLLMAEIQLGKGKHASAIPFLKAAAQLALTSEIEPKTPLLKPIAEKKPLSEKKNIFNFHTISLVVLALLFLILLVLFINQKFTQKRLLKEAEKRYLKYLDVFTKKEEDIEQHINQHTKELNEQIEESRQKDLALKKALKRAEDANYLKNAFLANMSHEIRMPLNGIIGFSSLLETELSLLENKELYEYATGIQQSGDRLLNLLNNIIDISRIEANEIEVDMHSCDVNQIMQHVFDLTVFSANEKALAFKSKLGKVPPVIADNAKLMRVFHIVVENAIKYTDEGFVTITSVYDSEKNQVIVKVKDTGQGMEEEYQQHLFEAFRQESVGYNRSYQGAGLGLPLAKRLLSLMFADIDIESKRDFGTTVKLYLACESPGNKNKGLENTQRIIAIPNAPEIGQLDIFIVEDDRMNRMVLEKILRKAGHLTMAIDGEESLKIISETHKRGHVFQVMLFDINLPSPWDGIKLMKEIRKTYKEYRYVPFIAQTAYAMAGDREKMLDAGFDDYIAKPINKNELMTIIKNQLDKLAPLQK